MLGKLNSQLLFLFLFSFCGSLICQSGGIAYNKIKGFNYYPQHSPWDTFGEAFDPDILQADFQLIRNMGFNTLRIFVQYDDFGGATVKSDKLKKLNTVLTLASKQGLGVIVTLFDFYNAYDPEQLENNYLHLTTLITSLKNHANLIAWDVKNEPDLDFSYLGHEAVLSWLEAILMKIQVLDGRHAVTIGWSKPEAALFLKEKLDFISFHFYKDLSILQQDIEQLRSKTHKPLVLSEFGFSSYSALSNLFASSERKQARYFAKALQILKENQLPYLLWTLYDFENIPNQVVGNKRRHQQIQKHFGVIGLDNKKKQAFEFVNQNKGLFSISLHSDY